MTSPSGKEEISLTNMVPHAQFWSDMTPSVPDARVYQALDEFARGLNRMDFSQLLETLNTTFISHYQYEMQQYQGQTAIQHFERICMELGPQIKGFTSMKRLDDDQALLFTRVVTLIVAKEISGLQAFPKGIQRRTLLDEFKKGFIVSAARREAPQVDMHASPAPRREQFNKASGTQTAEAIHKSIITPRAERFDFSTPRSLDTSHPVPQYLPTFRPGTGPIDEKERRSAKKYVSECKLDSGAFRGTSDPRSIRKVLAQLKRLAESEDMNAVEYQILLNKNLTEDVKDDVPEPRSHTFEELEGNLSVRVQTLIRRFAGSENSERVRVRREYTSIKQKSYEKIQDFCSRFESVVRDCRMLNIEPEDEDVALQFIQALIHPHQDHAIAIYDKDIGYFELRDRLIMKSLLNANQQGQKQNNQQASQNQNTSREKESDKSGTKKQVDCRVCGGPHYANVCTVPEKERTCNFCKGSGHTEGGCYKKKQQNKVEKVDKPTPKQPQEQSKPAKEAHTVEVELFSIETPFHLEFEAQDEAPELECIIGLSTVHALMDSGASCSIISENILKKAYPNAPLSNASEHKLRFADRTEIVNLKSTIIPVKFLAQGEQRTVDIPFLIMPSLQRSAILGRPALQQLGVRMSFGRKRSTIPRHEEEVLEHTKVTAEIFDISSEKELFTPDPEDPLTLYKIVSIVDKPIERQIQKTFEENKYAPDRQLTEEQQILRCSRHFLNLLMGLNWQEFADQYYIRLKTINDIEKDISKQEFGFELRWRLQAFDAPKPSWNSQRLIDDLKSQHSNEWQDHVKGFVDKNWWVPTQERADITTTIFPVIQKDTKTTTCRPCADMRNVNALSPKVSAEVFSVSDAVLKLRSLLQKGDCVIKQFDLSKAFYRIRVNVETDEGQSFPLLLKVGNQAYTSDRMVFGLSVGPSGLNAATHCMALITNTVWNWIHPDQSIPATVQVVDDFLFVGNLTSVLQYEAIYHVVWNLCGFESPENKRSMWQTHTPTVWLGQKWTFAQEECILSLHRSEIVSRIPSKWTKREVFRLAGKFTSLTHGFHEALARVHADALRRISGTWDTWDYVCQDDKLIADIRIHLAEAYKHWELCRPDDDSIPLTRDIDSIDIFTDACQRGYGFIIKARDQRIFAEAKLFATSAHAWHANRREYFAVSQTVIKLDGLLPFLPKVKHIRLYSDSRVTVAQTDQFKGITSKALERKVLMRMRNAILELAYLWKTAGINFRILHIAGVDNKEADELSRTTMITQSVLFVEIQWRHSRLISLPSFKQWLINREVFLAWSKRPGGTQDPTLLFRMFLLNLQQEDDRCRSVCDKIRQRDHPNESPTQGETRFLFLDDDGLLIRLHQGLKQVWVPDSILSDIIQHLHEQMGHASLAPVLASFFKIGFHPSVRTTAKRLIRSCSECNLSSRRTTGQSYFGPVEMPIRPFETIGMDLYGPLQRASGVTTKKSKKFVLTICDRLTGFTEFTLLENSKAIHVVNAFEAFCWRYGANIRTLVTDNGAQFTSVLLAGLCLVWGIRHVRIPAYSPHVGGFYEVRHRIATRCIRTLLVQYPVAKWSLLLSIAQAKINSHQGPDRSASPHQLLFGWEYSYPSENAIFNASNQKAPESWYDPFSSPEEEATIRSKLRNEFLILWREEFAKRQHEQSQSFDDEDSKKPVYEVGAQVYFVNDLIRRKFSPQSEGPYILLEKVGHHQWMVKGEDSAIPFRVHTKHLRLVGAPPQDTPEPPDHEVKPPLDRGNDPAENLGLASGNDLIRNLPKKSQISSKKNETDVIAGIDGSISSRGRLRRGSLIGN